MSEQIPKRGDKVKSNISKFPLVKGNVYEVVETSDLDILGKTENGLFVTLDYGEFDLVQESNGREKHNSEDAPDHYNAHSIEVIDFIQDWELNFSLGNVVKYVTRSPYKGTQMADLLKARNYLDFEIARLENMEGKR